MSNIKEKIKNVLPGHTHSSKEETRQGETRYGEERPVMAGTTGAQYDTAGQYTTTTTGAAGYGVVGDRDNEREGAYDTTGATTTTTGEAATCGKESFTKVEDRPRVIEQKEYIKEHRPMEKEFVTETKFVGEREMTEGRTTENLGTEERIIAQAQPKSPCE
ncbi:hypothetical protein Ndes2526A_g07899 [Nannochloris sp. 'desiccata']